MDLEELNNLKEENERYKKRIEQLENQLIKLKNGGKLSHKQHHGKRKFDFTRFHTRHIALKFCYLGWNYDGMVVQKDAPNTVMERLLEALEKSKLIENRETCNAKCCGRTDKGVSGLTQVVSIVVRSNLKNGLGIIPNAAPEGDVEMSHADGEQNKTETDELDYPFLLNCVLPEDIRILAWCPVPLDFSARFSCISRSYRYYFPKNNLNIMAMQKAASYLVGEHDFRNFCKHQAEVKNHVRSVHFVSIVCVENASSAEDPYEMFCFTIKASAFLYHQIRCILAVLFMVGNNLERPQIVKELLDVSTIRQKPQYNIASDLPLLFYETEFPADICVWRSSVKSSDQVLHSLQHSWTSMNIRATMLRDMIRFTLRETVATNNEHPTYLTLERLTKSHKELTLRPREKWNLAEEEEKKEEERRTQTKRHCQMHANEC